MKFRVLRYQLWAKARSMNGFGLRHQLRTEVCSMVCFWFRSRLRVEFMVVS